jgi:probable phosphoglycerate mutase
MQIYFLRHGECKSASLIKAAHPPPDDSLTARGLLQAHQTGVATQKLAITAILSSPLVRCLQTSDIVSAQLGLEYQVVPFLEEWRMPSDVIGKTREQYPAWYHEYRKRRASDWTEIPNDGESVQQLVIRVRSAIQYFHDELPSHAAILVISHAMCIRFMVGAYLLPPSSTPGELLLFANHLELRHCSLTHISLTEHFPHPTLLAINDCSHLSQDNKETYVNTRSCNIINTE